jgi:microcystin-dependent protein
MSTNWEQFGSLTPDEAAQEFINANYLTYEMRPCMAIGTVFMFGGTSAPEGSKVCDGASYDTDDYAALFAVIGYGFGGAGSSFNVPDMRRNFAWGAGSGVAVGDEGGTENVTLTEEQMPSHSHALLATITAGAPAPPAPLYGYSAVALLQTQPAGGDKKHSNMPPYVGMLHCIAYE